MKSRMCGSGWVFLRRAAGYVDVVQRMFAAGDSKGEEVGNGRMVIPCDE